MVWTGRWRSNRDTSVLSPISLLNPARHAAILLLATLLLQNVGFVDNGVQASPLPLPLQLRNDAPLYIAKEEALPYRQKSRLGQRDGQIFLAERDVEEHNPVAGMEEGTDGHGRQSMQQLQERQILPPPGTHPLTFIPGAFTRDAAAVACGPGQQLAAVDAYNWGQATSMTGGVGAWIRSWNTDNYQGTCIALYSINSINVPPQGCAQLLGALCEPGAPVAPPATPPPPPPPPKKKPPPKKPPPKKPKKKGGKV